MVAVAHQKQKHIELRTAAAVPSEAAASKQTLNQRGLGMASQPPAASRRDGHRKAEHEPVKNGSAQAAGTNGVH